MEDPALFDRRAEAYERGRPPYPPELYDRLRELGLMRPGLRVLDIGAGTGQATAEFVTAGAEVTAIEPGAALARRIAQQWPQVSVLDARFEDVDLPASTFDVAICATALHWLDLTTALSKLHDLLTSEGWFAAWWNVFGDTSVATPFRSQVAAITARRGPERRTHAVPLDTAYWVRELTTGGYLIPTEVKQFTWPIDLTTDEVRDLFSTFTGWSDAEVDEAARAVDDLGGRVTEHYVTVLYVCRIAPRTGP